METLLRVFLFMEEEKNAQHAQNPNQNQKGPNTIYTLSIWCTFGNHTVFAKLEGVPLGGRGLKCNLGLKDVSQSGFPAPTLRKLNSWWRYSAAEMQGNTGRN